MKIGSIILAGGKGERLGTQKSWAELGRVTLLQRAISNLEFLDSEIIVVKAPGAELPPVVTGISFKVVSDSVGGRGPLEGILTGLSHSRYSYNLVTACDMPLLNKDFVKYLSSVAGGFDAVVPRVGPHLEPLHAVYSKRCIMEIEKLLAQDKLKVDALFDRVRTRFIEPVEIDRFDETHMCFMNINTRADLVKAEGLLGRS